MAPKKIVDKGKAPMVAEEPQSRRPNTRSRAAGIMIRERQAQETGASNNVAQEESVQETPLPENVEGQRTQPRGADVTGPSAVPAPMPAEGQEPELVGVVRLLLGAFQEMRQDMNQYFAGAGQGRRPESPRSRGMSEVPLSEQARRPEPRQEEDEVQVVDLRPHAEAERQRERADMKAFQSMRPPAFRGDRDFTVVDDWVLKLEKIFEYLQCTDDQRVRYAIFMLEGEADKWWRTEKRRLPGRGLGLTWGQFLELFYQQYVPTSEKSKRAYEFASLIQGKMTVAEYDAKFRSLSRFVAWTEVDPRETARKFRDGLKPSIRGKLLVLDVGDYADILDRACRAEHDEMEWARRQDKKRGFEQTRRGGFSDRRQKVRWERQAAQGQPSSQPSGLPECAVCGKRHAGDCRNDPFICFGCGELGHRVGRCPNIGVSCFNCGQLVHRRDKCPYPRAAGLPTRVQQQPMNRQYVPGRVG